MWPAKSLAWLISKPTFLHVILFILGILWKILTFHVGKFAMDSQHWARRLGDLAKSSNVAGGTKAMLFQAAKALDAKADSGRKASFLGKIEATGRCCSVSETNGTEKVRILVKIYLIEFSAGLRNCRQTTDSQKTTRSYFNHGKNLMTSQWDPVKHGLVTSQSTGCIGRPFGLSFLLTSTPNWILKTIHATIWPMHILPRIFKAISLSTGHLS